MKKITRVYRQHGRYYYAQDLEGRNPKTGKPLQKWHPLTRIEEGEEALHLALAKLLGTPASNQGDMPARIEEYKKLHLLTLTPDVQKEQARMLGIIADRFAEFNVDQVLPGDVIDFLAQNFAGKLTARHHYKGQLSGFFAWCVLKNYIKVNPCAEIKLKSPPKRKGRFNAERYWQMHDALPPIGQCFLSLMFLSRQRPTEIRLLRESQIGDGRMRFVPTKTEDSTGEEVEILITPEIQFWLDRARAINQAARARKERKKSSDGKKVIELERRRDPFLIQTTTGGKFSKSGLNSLWTRAREAAGITIDLTTRDVRPYALSTMERAGYSLREIQKAAAHADQNTTEGYLDQHRDRLSDARIFEPQRPKT